MKRYKKGYISDVVGFTSNSENALILANMDKVASEASITHRAVNRLIINYKNLLMQSGSVRNKITPGSNHKKVYLLNASQCAFIIQRMNSSTAIRLQTKVANVFAYKSHKLLERQAAH